MMNYHHLTGTRDPVSTLTTKPYVLLYMGFSMYFNHIANNFIKAHTHTLYAQLFVALLLVFPIIYFWWMIWIVMDVFLTFLYMYSIPIIEFDIYARITVYCVVFMFSFYALVVFRQTYPHLTGMHQISTYANWP